MNNPILVIMAAGLGSRYGGSKQTDSVGQNNETIIDYSIFDALEAGFKKAVIIIKKDSEDIFKKLVGDRISKYIDIKYAYQELDRLPCGYNIPEGRLKPWGTCHAVLCAEKFIDSPFAVINADDYYGKDAFKKIYDFLKDRNNSKIHEYAMIGYLLKNTLSENGFVSRGICTTDEHGYIKSITERTKIEKTKEGARYTEDYGKTWSNIQEDSLVSMNIWGFTQSFLEEAKNKFPAFLDEKLKSNPMKCEYLLPSVIDDLINEGKASVKVLKNSDKWYGVTYKEDKALVVDAIKEKHDKGQYPIPLWSDSLNTFEAAKAFGFDKNIVELKPYGDGHINTTFKLVSEKNGKHEAFILQKINTNVFKEPKKVMFNIENITNYLKNQIIISGGDFKRETLNIVKTLENKSYYIDSNNQYWRVFLFIENAVCLQTIEKAEHMYETGRSFGKFLNRLSDFPANELYEIIPKFHHILKWFDKFALAVEKDCCNRACKVKKEIEFLLSKKRECIQLSEMLNSGALPVRVTHNDAKLSNILIDDSNGQGICIIDLDTVMAGVSAYDFGDSIRTGASSALEDESDLSKVKINLELYRAYVKGFLEQTKDILTNDEKKSLAFGVKLMTFETCFRFLTDYLEGDIYYKTNYGDHNLIRAKNQIKLIEEIEDNFDEMLKIIIEF